MLKPPRLIRLAQVYPVSPQFGTERESGQTQTQKKRNPFGLLSCGAYGTRTRDPMRDRHVF